MHVILQEEFRSLIKAELESQSVTRVELAERMGVKPPTISQYLNGDIVPGADMIEKFFKALDIEVHLSIVHKEKRTLPKSRRAVAAR